MNDEDRYGRFLEKEEKQAELDRFNTWRTDPNAYRGARGGGYGYIDQEILPLCDALNALPGVLTMQSCCGHGDGEYIHYGQLWLRLSEYVAGQFERKVGGLLASPYVRHVQKLYSYQSQKAPHEIVDIQFYGYESGQFRQSADVILKFFELLL